MSRRGQVWASVAVSLLEGAVAARDCWSNHRVVFACRLGGFVGYNGFSGTLEPFLVERLGVNRFSVYSPSTADLTADDWVILSADYIVETMPTEQLQLFASDGGAAVRSAGLASARRPAPAA